MLKKTITYTDYNGTERTEDFYFNINQSEIIEMEASYDGGLTNIIQKVINARDLKTVIRIFKDLVLTAYGEKSDDGKRFVKSDELRKAFSQTEAYNQLFMELATNSESAAAFVNGIMPSTADVKALTDSAPALNPA